VVSQARRCRVQPTLSRHHRGHLHRYAAHRAAPRDADLGFTRRRRTVLKSGLGNRSYEPRRDVTAVKRAVNGHCVRSVPLARARWHTTTARSSRSRTTRRRPMVLATVASWTGPIAVCADETRWLTAWWCSPATPATGWRRRFWLTLDLLPECDLPHRPLATELASAIGARVEPVPFRGTHALTDSSEPDGRGRRLPCTRTFVAEYRCGQSRADFEQRAWLILLMNRASGRWEERNRNLLDLEVAYLGLPCLSLDPCSPVAITRYAPIARR